MRITLLALSATVIAFMEVGCGQQEKSPQSFQSVPVEAMRLSPAQTRERVRSYTKVEGHIRRVDITFTDGCKGTRFLDGTAPDGTPLITSATEEHPDGKSIRYDFSVGGKTPIKVTCKGKDGKTYYEEKLGDDNKVVRTRFLPHPTSDKPRAILEFDKSAGAKYTFTSFALSGRRLYEERHTSNEFGEKVQRSVYVGQAKALYRQTWSPWRPMPAADGSGGSSDNDPAFTLQFVEEYHPDSEQVKRMIKPASVDVGNRTERGYEVHVFDEAGGKVTLVKLVTSDGRIVSVTDKTKPAEQTVRFHLEQTEKEAIDSQLLKSPVTEDDDKVKDELLKGPSHTHLARLLVP